MIEVKTSELIRRALDWAVAKGLGFEYRKTGEYGTAHWLHQGSGGNSVMPRYSNDWAKTGPLIDKYLIDLTVEHPSMICAALCDENGMYIDDKVSFGDTHLIAACRAIVAARLGDTVQIPDELAKRAGQ